MIQNPLRIIHEKQDGTVAFTKPDDSSRLVSSIRYQGKQFVFPEAVMLCTAMGCVITDEILAAVEIVDGDTDHQHAERVMQKAEACVKAKGRPYVRSFIVHEREMPVRNGEKLFRDAWRAAGDKVEVDIAKARECVLSRCRAERVAKLADADAEKMRADDMGVASTMQSLAAYRQSLRDLPAKIKNELAGLTVEQLADYQIPWPKKG